MLLPAGVQHRNIATKDDTYKSCIPNTDCQYHSRQPTLQGHIAGTARQGLSPLGNVLMGVHLT